MATYEWICNDCELMWDREYKLGKAPSKTKCPECHKISERLFYATPTHFKGHGFYETDYKDKSCEQDVKEFYTEAIKNSTERQKTGWQHYRRYELSEASVEQGLKDGRIVRTTDEKANSAKESEKEIAKDVFKKTGLDPTTYSKSKPQ